MHFFKQYWKKLEFNFFINERSTLNVNKKCRLFLLLWLGSYTGFGLTAYPTSRQVSWLRRPKRSGCWSWLSGSVLWSPWNRSLGIQGNISTNSKNLLNTDTKKWSPRNWVCMLRRRRRNVWSFWGRSNEINLYICWQAWNVTMEISIYASASKSTQKSWEKA